MNTTTHRWLSVWLIGGTLLMLAAYAHALLGTPLEMTMGPVQKLFYLHVPSAFTMFLSFALSGLAGAWYLWRRDPRADALCLAAAEVGWIFCTIVLITGPLWGKIAWGSWWTWEPRLTATLILWLTFSALFVLRQSLADHASAAMGAAVVALFGCLNIPIIMAAIRLWRGVHPEILRTEGALPPSMAMALYLCVAAIFIFSTSLIAWRAVLAQENHSNQGVS